MYVNHVKTYHSLFTKRQQAEITLVFVPTSIFRYSYTTDIQCTKTVLLHLRSFFKIFVCAYHILARIKVVHLRSFLVLHLRVYFHRSSLARC